MRELGSSSFYLASFMNVEHRVKFIPGANYRNVTIRAQNSHVTKYYTIPDYATSDTLNVLGFAAFSKFKLPDSAPKQHALTTAYDSLSHSDLIQELTSRVTSKSTSSIRCFDSQPIPIPSVPIVPLSPANAQQDEEEKAITSNCNPFIPASADLIRITSLKAKESRRWLTVTPDSRDLVMKDYEFCAAFRFRYNMFPSKALYHSTCNCDVASQDVIQRDHAHFMSCYLSQFDWTARHNHIRNVLARYARYLGNPITLEPSHDYITSFCGASNHPVSSSLPASDDPVEILNLSLPLLDPTIPLSATSDIDIPSNSSSPSLSSSSQPVISNSVNIDVQHQERLDILIRRLNIDYGVDVVVTHPNSIAKCKVSLKTLMKPLRAASTAASMKIHRYHQLISATEHRMRFYPFSCETYGALSASAQNLISDISLDSPDPTSFKQHLLSVVSVAIQRGNAQVLLKGVKRTHAKVPFVAALVHATA